MNIAQPYCSYSMAFLHFVYVISMFSTQKNANNPCAAVLPIFCKHFFDGTMPMINGDGETLRNFTYVRNAVQANIKTMLRQINGGQKSLANHEILNVACGNQITLNALVYLPQKVKFSNIKPVYGHQPGGHLRHSRACIQKTRSFVIIPRYGSLMTG